MFDQHQHNYPTGTIVIEDLEIGMSRSVSKTIGDKEIEDVCGTKHGP
jgi:3-hydroxybutyryl-CoA dehydratase